MRRAFISPTKYVQGENELLNLGYFVKTFGDSALLIAHPDDVARVKDKLESTKQKFNITLVEGGFRGECSRQEVARLQALAKEHQCACTIGLGGGKASDTAKCVAEGEALIIVPTIAATDAPTSHSAVLYTPEGEFDDYAYFKQSPSVVMIDTTVIAKAPTRFLVAGMGMRSLPISKQEQRRNRIPMSMPVCRAAFAKAYVVKPKGQLPRWDLPSYAMKRR